MRDLSNALFGFALGVTQTGFLKSVLFLTSYNFFIFRNFWKRLKAPSSGVPWLPEYIKKFWNFEKVEFWRIFRVLNLCGRERRLTKNSKFSQKIREASKIRFPCSNMPEKIYFNFLKLKSEILHESSFLRKPYPMTKSKKNFFQNVLPNKKMGLTPNSDRSDHKRTHTKRYKMKN